MRWFGHFGRRLAVGLALVTTATAGLVFGVSSSAAGFGLGLQSVADGNQTVADLAVDKSDSADPIQTGKDFHYNIRIRNLGPDDASGVHLVDTLPESFEFVSSTGAKSCVRDRDVYCELNDIPHDGSLTVILHVRASIPGTFTDTATVSSAVADPNQENNRDSETTTVSGDPDEQPTAHLIVVEHVTNDNGGKAGPSDFALAVKGGSANPAEFSGSADGTDVMLDAGPYAVSQETALGYLTTFSPDCQGTIEDGKTTTCTVSNDDLGPVTLALVADEQSVPAGATATYTATLTNPNAQSTGVSNLGVTLAGGFSYQAGSTSGATSSDPQLDQGEGSALILTWAGPLELLGNGTASLRFSLTAPLTPGDYYAGVTGTVDVPFTLQATNDTAPVKVVAAGGGQTPPSGPAPGQGPSTSQPPKQGQTTTTTASGTAQLAPPEFQKTADIEPVSGDVLVRLSGTTDFVPLTVGMQVGFGAEIDATGGRVEVSTVDASNTLFHADFYEGRFLMAKQLGDGVTVLQLSGSSFRSCKKVVRTLAAFDKKKPKKARKKVKRSKKVVRHLWGSGKGKFRTRGRFLAATVHGTTWLTEDRCDGSRTFVQEGVVDVRDLVKHKTIQLGAGHSYVARPGH